ncbi:MAG: cell division protein FtsZ [Bacteroidetes bacterium]|nr:cell division protein FtsZ [Bacteroidota bacterium]
MQFDLQQEPGSIIKVIGVGGGGSNAVNHMFRQGIKGVDFIVCNTDKQALEVSPVTNKIQLGFQLTKGLGAGSIPEMGRNSALETIDDIRKYLSDGTQMVFITAGLGGGTGTGAAPIIASVAKEMGILTVAIVTLPFTFEGKKRKQQADAGLEELKKYVDTLLVICNDKLREIYGNLKMSEAFAHADNVLTGAAKSIAEIISLNLHINVDFNDVKTVMKDSGVSIMGTASASGEKRAVRAVEAALNSPLLNDNNIRGARHVLLNIMSGSDDISMDEFTEITDYIQEESGYSAELITGYGIDQSLGDSVNVTIIATGFQSNIPTGFEPAKKLEREVVTLSEEVKTPIQEVVQTTIVDVVEEAKNEAEPFIITKNENQVVEAVVEPVQEVVSEVKFELETPEMVEFTAEVETPIVNEVEDNNNSIEFVINEIETEFTSSVEDKVEEPSFSSPVSEEIVFNEIKSDVTSKVEEPVRDMTAEEIARFEREEKIKAAQERIKKLKDLSLKMKSPEGLYELEKEPSFVRQNIKIEDSNYSTESNVSRYTLSEGDDKKMEIKPNNPFLHDNVD